ncbi:ATP-dependent endonuclease [Arthrobacter sp. 24S4-2]|uniref:ATP-dependent nuclease n=1 Tax=Arthrobacter sp. 24S4-2 TaxID=2575374 RepID=UPI0020C79654|nr:AAA family ATPase [Arthrobacter sp. 24S4-2]
MLKLRTQSFSLENLRHEFKDEPTSLSLRYATGAVIHLVWPVDSPAFFWLENLGHPVVTAAAAKMLISPIGVAPTLTPLDRDEKQLSSEHLRSHIDTKLSSRHFRNNLFAIREVDARDFEGLNRFLLENTPELADLQLIRRIQDGEAWIDLYYRDAAGRTEKEIVWAGDGLQIWIQILFHIWRCRDSSTIVLDEPDVFLHPDLQRRLVRILEAQSQQIIVSSHAAEVASEADPQSLVWIERGSRAAKRLSSESYLGGVAGGLGRSFNLSIAHALKAKVALFVEGEDVKIIRILAERVGCSKIAKEEGLAVVPIGGFNRWPSVETFAWLKDGFLDSGVKVRLILDSDYRAPADCRSLESDFLKANVDTHIWHRKELESYLLDPAIIAAATGLDLDEVITKLNAVVDELKWDVFGQLAKQGLDSTSPHLAASTVLSEAQQSFFMKWSNLERKLHLVPAQKVISGWNRQLTGSRQHTLTSRSLASAASPTTLDWEMVEVLQSIESDLSSANHWE